VDRQTARCTGIGLLFTLVGLLFVLPTGNDVFSKYCIDIGPKCQLHSILLWASNINGILETRPCNYRPYDSRHGRNGEQETRPPGFGMGNDRTVMEIVPSDFVMFQNFKDQIACISLHLQCRKM